MSFSCNHSLDGSFPPSPAEDGGSKRLSWGSLLQRLTELKGINHRATADHQCSRSETGECGSLFVSGGSTVFFKIGLTHAVAKKLYLWLHLLKHKGHELTKHKELKGMQGVLLISRLSQAAQDFNLYSFCFRICGRHVAVRVRQQFLLLPPGGDPGYRGCGNYNTNSEWCIRRPGLLQTHPTWLLTAQYQPRAAPPGRQRALRPERSCHRPVCGQGGPGLLKYCGSNSSGCHPGPNFPCDPGAEARVQWAVAKGPEALQGWRLTTDICKAPEHSEAEYELQGYQEETVLFRGAPDWGVLLTEHSRLWLAELNSYVLWKAAGGLSIVCLWRQYRTAPTRLMALTRWSWK